MESTLSDLLGKALSKLKMANGSAPEGGSGSAKENYLRNASLSRAEMHIRNHAEGLDLNRWTEVSADALDESGLDEEETKLICDWFGNKISGMHCVCLLQAKWSAEATEQRGLGSSSEGSSTSKRASATRSLLTMMGSLIDFPVDALELETSPEDNFLYTQLFSRPPLAVIGEVFGILQDKAIENNPTTMLAEQVNLAFKQFRVERIRSRDASTGSDGLGRGNGDEGEIDSDVEDVDDDGKKPATAGEVETEGESDAAAATAGAGAVVQPEEDDGVDGREEQMYFKILMELVKQYVKSSEVSLVNGFGGLDGMNGGLEGDAHSMLDVNAMQIECELDTPLDQVVAEAETLTHVELNEINVPLKNYITRLSGLKHGLDRTLKEVEESESYLALGVHKDSSDNEIRRAYHKLSLKTHPDKPGGDTAKFQTLQKAYQEVQKRRSIELAAQADIKAQSEGVGAAASGREAALALVSDMHASVTVAKSAAEQIAALAQMAIHLAKTTTSVEEEYGYPEGVSMLRRIIFDEEGVCRLDLLRAALEPAESMSEALQGLSASSVELAGCGPRYSSTAARSVDFSKTTEAAMQAGLTLLRCVTSLMQVERHVNECVEKLQESIWQVEEDRTIHDIIAQMVVTVVKCCSTTMSSVAEKALGAALVAADAARSAQEIFEAAEREALAEAKAKAEIKEKMSNFTDENNRNGANSTAAGDEEKKKNEEEEEEKKKKEQENEPQEGDGLADLQSKVKNLQVQIRVQNISILQTLNAEARHLQGKLQERLVELAGAPANAPLIQGPVMRLVADLVDHSCETLRGSCSSGAVENLQDWEDLLADRLGWMRDPRSGRLALLPDLRSRAMWMGVLADRSGMETLVTTEVRRRLKACLKACPLSCSWAVRDAKTRKKDGTLTRSAVVLDTAKASVDIFLDDVVVGITALANVTLTVDEEPVQEATGGPDGGTAADASESSDNIDI